MTSFTSYAWDYMYHSKLTKYHKYQIIKIKSRNKGNTILKFIAKYEEQNVNTSRKCGENAMFVSCIQGNPLILKFNITILRTDNNITSEDSRFGVINVILQACRRLNKTLYLKKVSRYKFPIRCFAVSFISLFGA